MLDQAGTFFEEQMKRPNRSGKYAKRDAWNLDGGMEGEGELAVGHGRSWSMEKGSEGGRGGVGAEAEAAWEEGIRKTLETVLSEVDDDRRSLRVGSGGVGGTRNVA